MRTTLGVLAALLSFQSYSFATPADEAGIQAALDARDTFVKALENKDFTSITHDTMDSTIRDLADQIRTTVKDDVMADELLNQWTDASTHFEEQIATRVSTRDLGDHPPLFPWLAAYITKLTTKYSILGDLQIIKDITIMNYAIPVVFTPHGSWESPTVDNRIEYRLHFIPFSDIVTYYASYYGCKLALAHYGLSDLKKICPKAANKLEWVNGRYIAPHVSDWIFKAANKGDNSSIEITDSDLQFETVAELRNAIQD
jgi:hypothetical protein